jgi:hypothetical protein
LWVPAAGQALILFPLQLLPLWIEAQRVGAAQQYREDQHYPDDKHEHVNSYA